MKKMKNVVHAEGYLYEHELEMKTSGPNSKKPGTEFIRGTIGIATDEELKNIVEFHFTYVTATTSTGKSNATFTLLKDIIDGRLKTAMEDGKEGAAKLRVDSAIGLNDFYTENGGEWRLASPKRNEGGFVHVITDSINDSSRNYFTLDMVITRATRLDEDEERKLPERMTLGGVCFDFRGQILPIELLVYNPKAMDYFEGCEISNQNPLCTEVSGNQVNTTIVREIREENAFGDDIIRESTSSRKEYVLTRSAKVPYEWDSEDFITAEKLAELVSERETYLAGVKQRAIEWKEQKANQAAPVIASATAKPAASTSGGFNF